MCVYVYLLHVYTCLWLHVSTYLTPNQLTATRWQFKSDSKSDRTHAYVTGLVHGRHDSPKCDTTYSRGTWLVWQQFDSKLVSTPFYLYLYLYINTSRHTCTAQCMSASAARANQYVYISISTICTDLNICIFSELYIRFSKFTQPLYCDMQRIRMCDTTQ